MNDEAVKILFEALSYIMSQNQKIERHLGISKYDSEWGWDDYRTEDLINNCNSKIQEYDHR